MATKADFNIAYLASFIREVNSRMVRAAIAGDPPEVIAVFKAYHDAALALLGEK
jgi:hypothetical protein